MNIQARLEIFLKRLAAAPSANNAEEAMELVCQLIEQVEDEHCPVSRAEPPPLVFTGRMYAPRADRMRRILPQGTLVADTRHHRIYCQPDGQISIVRMSRFTEATIFFKEGRKK